LNDLAAKNSSLQDLQKHYLTKSEELGVLTKDLEECKRNVSSRDQKIISGGTLLAAANEKIKVLEGQLSDKHESCEKRLQGFRVIIREMQRHLQCLQTEEACLDVAGLYTCLPVDLSLQTCLPTYTMGQELFGLELCVLLGDSTWQRLSSEEFMRHNPRIAAWLILMFTFAIIGLLVVLLLLVWMLARCRSGFVCGRAGGLPHLPSIVKRPRAKKPKSQRGEEFEMKEKITTEAEKKKTKPPRPPVADLNADWNASDVNDPTGVREANGQTADDPESEDNSINPAPEGACGGVDDISKDPSFP